jgi:hypothetical protein
MRRGNPKAGSLREPPHQHQGQVPPVRPAESEPLKDTTLAAEKALLQILLEERKFAREVLTERKRFWRSTPLMLALVGTITIVANGLVVFYLQAPRTSEAPSYSQPSRTTADLVTPEQVTDWLSKLGDYLTRPEVAQPLAKLQRFLELQTLGLSQAQMDEKQATAVGILLKALEPVPEAAVQVGSVIVLKIPSSSGPILHVRTLTNSEVLHLEKDGGINRPIREVLQSLQTLPSPPP